MIDSMSKPNYKRLDNNGHYLVAVSKSESLFLVDIRQSIEHDFKLDADWKSTPVKNINVDLTDHINQKELIPTQYLLASLAVPEYRPSHSRDKNLCYIWISS